MNDLQQAFRNPPDDSRIMMRWWWFGPAVTKPQLAREMRLMKEGGIGGFEVQPVYALALDDEKTGIRNLPYLSEEFLNDLRFTAETARNLGLRMDLTLGSGWPYGGPRVPIADAAARMRLERKPVAAGSHRVKMPNMGAGESLVAAVAVYLNGDAVVPDKLREVLILAYYHRFPYRDIVDVVNIPLGTVKSRLHAAVACFADCYRAAVREHTKLEP